MANPQAENGHVDLAHEIIEALARYRINGEAMQCLWVVFRKTYGWKKTEDEISLSQFVEMTGLKRANVVRAIKWLVSRKILGSIKEDTTYANKYRFNKDFETWTYSIKKDTTRKGSITDDTHLVSKKITRPVSSMIHTKENYTKETIKRKRTTFQKPTIEEVKAYCLERSKGVDPEKWYDHYESNGWRVGKNPMKDWKAAVRTWERNNYGGSNGLQNNGSGRPRESDRERRAREAKDFARRKLGIRGTSAGFPVDISPNGINRGGSKFVDCTVIEGSSVEIAEDG